MKLSVAVLEGDGVGPEVVLEGVKVLGALAGRFGHELFLQKAAIGAAAFVEKGEALPQDTLDACRSCDAILLGAVGDPKYETPGAGAGPEPGYGLIRLRRELGLFANIRPVRFFPAMIQSICLKEDVVKGADFIILRELAGGIYFGKPKGISRSPEGRSAVDTLAYKEEEIARIIRLGFELARTRRKKLTSVDKFRILASSDLWREIAGEIALEYPDVLLEHALVDSCAMRLIINPRDFDVLVTENLFGDILSDEVSVIAGSLGLMPSASLAGIPGCGKVFGLYEPIHGSAPLIAGKNSANPIAAILSVALMLRYSFGLFAEAEKVENAVNKTLNADFRTDEIMSEGKIRVETDKMGDIIAGEI